MATQLTTSLVKWEDIAAQVPGPGAKLNDARIGLQIASASVKTPISLSGPVSLEIAADAAVRLDGFNSAQQADDDGVLGGQNAPVPFDVASTWLKYSVAGSARATVSVGAGMVAADGSASQKVTVCDYRRHQAADTVVAAVTADIEKPRVIFSIDDIKALGPGDALAFRVAGALNASVTVSWSDVFTSEIGSLARLLRAPVPIAIDLDASVTATAAVEVDDEFALTFVRAGAGYRVFVRKAHMRSIDATVGVTARVGLTDPKAVAAAMTGLLDAPIDRVNGLLKRAVDTLTPVERQLLAAVAERLGVANATPDTLGTAVTALQATLTDKLAGIVTQKVEASFSFEYGRIDERETLLQASLDDAALAALHGDLMRRDLTSTLTGGAGITLENYLDETSETRTRAWGFTLGFGRARLFGKDSTEVKRVRRIGLAGSSRSYSVVHKYDATRRNWSMTLKADMASLVAAAMPITASSFSYGLHLLSSEQSRVFDDAQADYCADMAVIWGICREGQAPLLRTRFPAIGTSDVVWVAQMTVNDEALKKHLWTRLGSLSPADFAASLASAVEWHHALAGTIASVARRRQLYFPIWQYYLQNPGVSAGSLAQFAYDRLVADAPATAALEKGGFRGADPRMTAAGIVDVNGDTATKINDFLRGAKNIATALPSHVDEQGTVGDALEHLAKMSDESHQVRATGVLLLDLARESVYLPGLTRTLSFTVGNRTTVLSSNDF